MAASFCVRSLAALALSVLLSACAFWPYARTAPSAPAKPSFSEQLAGSAWTAFFVDGVDEVLAPKPQLRWTAANQIAGSGGCNAFEGRSVGTPDDFRIGPLVPVGTPCQTLAGGQEDRFFRALEGTRRASVQGEQLLLTDAAGKPLARLLRTH